MINPVLYRSRFLLPISAPPVEDGALVVDGVRIVAVGRYSELAEAFPAAQSVDFGDAALLPPLANAHTHLELTDFPTWASAAGEPELPGNFVDWILWLVRVRRGIDDSQLAASLANGLRACLLTGTGAIGDILTSLTVAGTYRQSPLSGRIFAEILGQDRQAAQERMNVIGDLLRQPPSASTSWGLSPHSPYTLSAPVLDLVFAFAADKDLACAIHLAESSQELHFLRDGSGEIADKLYAAAGWSVDAVTRPAGSPVEYLCRQGRLTARDLAVHGVQMVAADIDLLRGTGCPLVLCPRSNAALGVGKAPVAACLAAGVPLALGTDSLASAPSLSVWEELAFARSWFAGAAPPRAWLEMATLGGARALGLQDRTGRLEPGCEASFQVVPVKESPGLDQLEEALCAIGGAGRPSHLFLRARNVLPQG